MALAVGARSRAHHRNHMGFWSPWRGAGGRVTDACSAYDRMVYCTGYSRYCLLRTGPTARPGAQSRVPLLLRFGRFLCASRLTLMMSQGSSRQALLHCSFYYQLYVRYKVKTHRSICCTPSIIVSRGHAWMQQRGTHSRPALAPSSERKERYTARGSEVCELPIPTYCGVLPRGQSSISGGGGGSQQKLTPRSRQWRRRTSFSSAAAAATAAATAAARR